jgi:aryl-alcohol dehydrogenase-like predicted oxidoreductase
MDVRTLGGSDLKTPRLVLGGNVFGWTATGTEAFDILDRFVAAGGTMIDTADVYSAWIPGHKGGESETFLGEWLQRRGHRDDILIATKVGMLPLGEGARLNPARIAAAAEASMKRLGTHIDLYYAHQDDTDTPLAETLAGFDALVKAGKVRAIGASNYTGARLAEALDISAREGLARYAVLQPEYNLMVRDNFEGDRQRVCIDRNVGSLPYFGLASGFLTGKYRSADDKAKSVRGGRMDAYLTDRGFAVLAALDEVAAEAGATPAQVALAWLAAQPGVTAPIASATSRAQLDELLGVLTLELTAEQVERLTAAGA